ncbi:hypothetical protein [Sorangium sp. So ce1151]
MAPISALEMPLPMSFPRSIVKSNPPAPASVTGAASAAAASARESPR